MIDGVLVDAGAFGDDLAHLPADRAQETGGAYFRFVPWIVGEDTQQIAIVNSRPIEIIFLALLSIVFAQRRTQFGNWFNLGARAVAWLGSGQLVHQRVDVFKFSERRPAFVTSPPARTRRQPNCKRLGEVFSRMRLRVPGRQVQHKLPAFWFRFVELRVALRERSEVLAPLTFEVQTK